MLRELVRMMNLRHLRRQKLRAVLALFGVVMGVSSFIFAPTLASSIHASLKLTTSDLSGNAVIEIQSAQNGFDADLLTRAQAVAGVKAAIPFSSSGGLIAGQSELLVFFGIDPATDRMVRTYHIAQGEFLRGPGEVLLSEPYAREKGLSIGQQIGLISAGGLRQLIIVGTLSGDEGIARLNGGDSLVIGLDDALALRGARTLDTISILALDGTDADTLVKSLQAALPSSVVVKKTAENVKDASIFAFVVDAITLVIGLMMMGFGSMLIYNTMAVSVAQRRAEIGLLRALGMDRGDVVRLFTVEAAILGAIGSFLGVFIGYLLVSIGSQLPVIPQLTQANVAYSEAAITVPTWLVPVAFLIGIIIPTFAGYWPSRGAARVDPVESLVQIRSEIGSSRIPWRQLVAALALVAVMLIVRYTYRGDLISFVLIANASVLLTFLVIALAYPSVLIASGRVLPQVMYRLFGTTGLMAADNVTRRTRRMLPTGLLVALTIAMFTVISESNFGYSSAIDEWNQGENLGDLTLVGAGRDPFNPLFPIPSQVVEGVKRRPDVAGVVPERLLATKQNGLQLIVRATDISAFRALGGRFSWNRGDEAAAYDRLLDTDHPAVLVSTNALSAANGWDADATLTVDTPQGPIQFGIAGTYLGRIESDRVTVVMHRTLFDRFWNDSQVDRLSIKLKPGADVQAVRRDLLRQVALNGVLVYANEEVKAAFAKTTNSISTVSSFMTPLLWIILISGLGSTIFVQVLDRRREIGMLRALGALPHQIVLSILLEAVLLVLIGAVVGLPGAALINVLQQMAMQQIMGLRFSLNLPEVTVYALLILLAAIVAAFIPARSAGKVEILDALHYE